MISSSSPSAAAITDFFHRSFDIASALLYVRFEVAILRKVVSPGSDRYAPFFIDVSRTDQVNVFSRHRASICVQLSGSFGRSNSIRFFRRDKCGF